MKVEQERRIVEDNKQVVHEQLVQAVSLSLNNTLFHYLPDSPW